MSNSLEHIGVKGMRWGVRKKSSASVSPNNNSNSLANLSITDKHIKDKRKALAANRRLMSTKDLDFTIARLEKEKKLKQLIDDDVTPGKRVALAITSEVGTNIIKKTATGAGTYAVKVAIGKKMGKEAAEQILPKKKK